MAGTPEVLGLRQWVKLIGARVRIGAVSARMIAISRGVAIIAEVADDQVTAGKATLQLSFEGRIAKQTLPLPSAHDGDGGPLGRIDELGGGSTKRDEHQEAVSQVTGHPSYLTLPPLPVQPTHT